MTLKCTERCWPRNKKHAKSQQVTIYYLSVRQKPKIVTTYSDDKAVGK